MDRLAPLKGGRHGEEGVDVYTGKYSKHLLPNLHPSWVVYSHAVCRDPYNSSSDYTSSEDEEDESEYSLRSSRSWHQNAYLGSFRETRRPRSDPWHGNVRACAPFALEDSFNEEGVKEYLGAPYNGHQLRSSGKNLYLHDSYHMEEGKRQLHLSTTVTQTGTSFSDRTPSSTSQRGLDEVCKVYNKQEESPLSKLFDSDRPPLVTIKEKTSLGESGHKTYSDPSNELAMASIKAKCATIVHMLDVKQARSKGRHVTSEVSTGERKYVNGERNNFPDPEDTMEKNMNEIYVQDEDCENGFDNEEAQDGHCEKIKESWLVEEARNTQSCVEEEGMNEILVAVPEDAVVDVGQDMDGGSLQECGMEADIKVDTSCLAGEDDPVYTVFMGDQAEEEHEYKMRYAGVETSVSRHVETADHVKKQCINLMGFPEKEDVSNGDRGTTLAEWALIMDALEAERLLKETMGTSNQAREADKAHIIPEIVARARNSLWKTVDVALEDIRNVQGTGNWKSSSSGIGIDVMLEGKDAPLEETGTNCLNVDEEGLQHLQPVKPKVDQKRHPLDGKNVVFWWWWQGIREMILDWMPDYMWRRSGDRRRGVAWKRRRKKYHPTQRPLPLRTRTCRPKERERCCIYFHLVHYLFANACKKQCMGLAVRKQKRPLACWRYSRVKSQTSRDGACRHICGDCDLWRQTSQASSIAWP